MRLVEYDDLPAESGLRDADASATRALGLDPSLSWGHLALASVRTGLDWNWSDTESHYQQALRLSPNCEAVHYLYARFLAAMGRPREALTLAARACDIDPLCLVVTTSEGWVHYLARNHLEALRTAHHVLDMDADFAQAHQLAGVAALELGRGTEAVHHFHRAAELQQRHPTPLAWLAHGLASVGRSQEADALLEELTTRATHRYVSPYGVALVQTALGRCDEVLDALSLACADRAYDLVNLGVEPRFDPLRHAPRFEQLLHQLGLADINADA